VRSCLSAHTERGDGLAPGTAGRRPMVNVHGMARLGVRTLLRLVLKSPGPTASWFARLKRPAALATGPARRSRQFDRRGRHCAGAPARNAVAPKVAGPWVWPTSLRPRGGRGPVLPARRATGTRGRIGATSVVCSAAGTWSFQHRGIRLSDLPGVERIAASQAVFSTRSTHVE
jgi:hypothetical protein